MASIQTWQPAFPTGSKPSSPNAASIALPDSPPTSPTPESKVPAKKYGRYYIQDDMAIFLVEDRLYKVHRHFLIRESEIFKWMFMCPPGSDGPDGCSDDRPIPLTGVTCEEFESLLGFFYDGMHDDRTVSLEEWVALLSISTRFDFEKIRDRAIMEIDSGRHELRADLGLNRRRRGTRLDPITKITIAIRHDVPQWLAPAYAQLCQRIEPIDELEGEKLGMKLATMVMRAREAVRDQDRHGDGRSRSPLSRASTPAEPWEPPTPIYQPFSTSMVARVVQEVFFPIPSPRSENGSI